MTIGARLRVAVSGVLLAGALAGAAAAAETTVSHGLSAFGDLEYGADFQNFAYVNPAAPKGGTLRLRGIDSFDSVNPFTLKGVPADWTGLLFESLMARADDEPDAMYGLIAESVEMPADRRFAIFTIRPEARWWDGTPITAEDVVFSYRTLVRDGHPRYRLLYRDFAAVEAVAPKRVKFTFRPGQTRDLPLLAAAMPILSKAYWQDRDFAATTFTPPLSSGPYRIARVDPGRSITYQRVADYWGRDVPVNRGRYNFDSIRVDYYRDRAIAREAFFAGEYDFREEFTSRSWATEYDDKPAVKAGLIVRKVLPDHQPSGVQAFFINTRRKKFADRRVRQALNLAFDFAWTNENLFYGLYERTTSMFENSPLAAKGKPSEAEIALLEPFRDRLPKEVFERAFAPPKTDGTGNPRKNLRRASRLLRAAGWHVKGGVLRNPDGEPLEIEFLMFESSFQRVIGPYIKNLERLGFDARMRIVDVANYENRMRSFDYDIVTRRFVMPLTPGAEQRNFWTSAAAEVPGSSNLSGVHDPVVDALVEKVIGAPSREALVTAVRALDRVLMWGYYVVPHWYKGVYDIAYWNKFDRPATKPRYALGVVDTWWFDPAKARLIEAGTAPPAD